MDLETFLLWLFNAIYEYMQYTHTLSLRLWRWTVCLDSVQEQMEDLAAKAQAYRSMALKMNWNPCPRGQRGIGTATFLQLGRTTQLRWWQQPLRTLNFLQDPKDTFAVCKPLRTGPRQYHAHPDAR